jgi:hypothetical protein
VGEDVGSRDVADRARLVRDDEVGPGPVGERLLEGLAGRHLLGGVVAVVVAEPARVVEAGDAQAVQGVLGVGVGAGLQEARSMTASTCSSSTTAFMSGYCCAPCTSETRRIRAATGSLSDCGVYLSCSAADRASRFFR